jgi:hypothetical protein
MISVVGPGRNVHILIEFIIRMKFVAEQICIKKSFKAQTDSPDADSTASKPSHVLKLKKEMQGAFWIGTGTPHHDLLLLRKNGKQILLLLGLARTRGDQMIHISSFP